MTLVESRSASVVDGYICIDTASLLSMILPFSLFVFLLVLLCLGGLVVSASGLNVEGSEAPDFRVGKTIPSGVDCVSEGRPQEGLKPFTSLTVDAATLLISISY